MNKFISQVISQVVSQQDTDDVSRDVAKGMINKMSDHLKRNSTPVWNYLLIDIDELSGFVTSTARNIHRTLGSGLPLCVYQLKLFNDLTKKGLKLKSGKSALRCNTKSEGDKNLTIVNDVLVVEYLSSPSMLSDCERAIKLCLHENNYAMALLVYITDASSSEPGKIEIIKIEQNYIAH